MRHVGRPGGGEGELKLKTKLNSNYSIIEQHTTLNTHFLGQGREIKIALMSAM